MGITLVYVVHDNYVITPPGLTLAAEQQTLRLGCVFSSPALQHNIQVDLSSFFCVVCFSNIQVDTAAMEVSEKIKSCNLCVRLVRHMVDQ